MVVTEKDLADLRRAYKTSKSMALANLYVKMSQDFKPNITNPMRESADRIIGGNTLQEVSDSLDISKAAVGQNAIKAFHRLAEFWVAMGGAIDNELQGSFNMSVVKRHLEFFRKAMDLYNNPQISLAW